MFISGIGTALPARRYSQGDCWTAIQASPGFVALAPRSRAILRKVLTGANGIDARHLSMDSLAEAFELTPDALHHRFATHAPALAADAARRALEAAGLAASDVDAILVSTCTGYLCPGLTSHVSERLGLRSGVTCLDLVGQGCGAALPNLQTATALLAAGRARHVVSICVEVCSAAFYLDDDPGVLISACLFGDGAAAAVVSASPRPGRRRVRWDSGRSMVRPEWRDELRFEQRGGMLRNILRPSVPDLAAGAAEVLLAETLAVAGRAREDIRSWIWHAGGRDVLSALKKRLGLGEADVRRSAEVLREHGNISSPCVLFVLRDTLAAGAPGGWWWMSSFGAGFSCHGALLEVE